MSNKLCVSVIVPVYRAEKYIQSCIVSIQKQSYGNIEIIIVDDGSPDGSGRIADRLQVADSRIIVIHTENKGVSSARNTGFVSASGDIVVFVDADDELAPEAVSQIVAAAEQADIVVYGWKVINESGSLVKSFTPPDLGLQDVDSHLKNLLDYNMDEYLFTYAFKKDKMIRNEFKEGFLIEGCGLFEDVWSIHCVLRAGEYVISYIPRALYKYRQVEGSATHRHDPKLAAEGLTAIRSLSSMEVPKGYEAKWRAKLLLMALSGADWAAGPGLGDGQHVLHEAIGDEVKALAFDGGLKALNNIGRLKVIAFFIGLYRPLRRLRAAFRRLHFYSATSAIPANDKSDSVRISREDAD